MRQIAAMLMPEAVSRTGNKWYAAVKNGSIASMIRGTVINSNIDGLARSAITCCLLMPGKHFTRTGQLFVDARQALHAHMQDENHSE